MNAPKVLTDAELQTPRATLELPGRRDHQSGEGVLGGRHGTDLRQLPTLPAGTTYAQVRTAIVNAFENITDPGEPGGAGRRRLLLKEELRDVDGSDSLHPNRSGDVVVVLRPPYQFDAATPGQTIAFSQFFGQHGYFPDLVDLEHNVNMHGTFVAAGPGIRRQDPVEGIRAVDVAPTISFLMGIPGPQNARGRIMTDLFPTPGPVEDRDDPGHQRLPRAAGAARGTGGQPRPRSSCREPVVPDRRCGVPGVLVRRLPCRGPGGSITVAAGDSVGATPPISSFFGDTPTIEIMNMMGFSADGLGNHNFDKGEQYLRNTLIPLANFPYLSSNIVDANGNTPAEWDPSAVFTFDGFKVGLVGFSNEDIPSLIFPGGLGPFHVDPRVPAVQAEVDRLRSDGRELDRRHGSRRSDRWHPDEPDRAAHHLADAVG